MASKHRKRSQAAKRIATVGAATATVTVLYGRCGTSAHGKRRCDDGYAGAAVDAARPRAPDPASIPDLTFGYGSQAYNQFQTSGAALETAFLNNVNLSGLLQRLGFDPADINTALGTALTGALAGLPIDPSGIPVLGPILKNAGITNVAAVLKLLGFDLADPLA